MVKPLLNIMVKPLLNIKLFSLLSKYVNSLVILVVTCVQEMLLEKDEKLTYVVY